jgi:hypothetical protein
MARPAATPAGRNGPVPSPPPPRPRAPRVTVPVRPPARPRGPARTGVGPRTPVSRCPPSGAMMPPARAAVPSHAPVVPPAGCGGPADGMSQRGTSAGEGGAGPGPAAGPLMAIRVPPPPGREAQAWARLGARVVDRQVAEVQLSRRRPGRLRHPLARPPRRSRDGFVRGKGTPVRSRFVRQSHPHRKARTAARPCRSLPCGPRHPSSLRPPADPRRA